MRKLGMKDLLVIVMVRSSICLSGDRNPVGVAFFCAARPDPGKMLVAIAALFRMAYAIDDFFL